MNEDEIAIDSDDHKSYFSYKVIEPLLIPVINTPYQCFIDYLINLWKAVEICSQHNGASALLTFGAVAMNMHFQTLVELKGAQYKMSSHFNYGGLKKLHFE